MVDDGDAMHASRGKGNARGMNLLINVVVELAIIGVALWLINRFLPMASSIRSILNFVVVIAVIVWLLRVFGIWNVSSLHL